MELSSRLLHRSDSYEIISTDSWAVGIIRGGCKYTWDKRYPWQRIASHNPTISLKASHVLDKDVQGLLDKDVILEVEPVQLRVVRKWFQQGHMCAELDLMDAVLHVPIRSTINNLLRFK